MTRELLSPTTRMLRQFAGLWIVFFGVGAIVQEVYRGRHTLALALGILAVTIGPLGLAKPAAIKPVFVGWTALAYPIGWTVSRIILGLLFFGVFTPVAWFLKLQGRDELKLKPSPDTSTYWRPKPQASDQAQYLRQF